MLDPKLLRQDLPWVIAQLARRHLSFDQSKYENLEVKRKALQVDTEQLQNQRKLKSKTIGQLKAQQQSVDSLMAEMNDINLRLEQLEQALQQVQTEMEQWLLTIPNLPHASVPEGKDDQDNQQIRIWGQPREFTFAPKDHVALGEQLMAMDFEVAAKLSGSRFAVLYGELAQLHRALAQFMLNTHIGNGYQEVWVPNLVSPESLLGTGQLPKFADDLFHIAGDRPLYLIPTAEVPVTNLVRDCIVPVEQLPLKYVCHSSCFRSEAGAYGQDTRGLIRQHQFEKVELVHIVRAEASYDALEAMTAAAEGILQALGLPYRVMLLCSGDMGFSAAKTYDLEVWLPGQQRYREISSCSNTEAFQSRRLQARWRHAQMPKPELLHTLNGSALAVGRTLVAVLENYQQADGSISIPAVLQPYMQGKTKLLPPASPASNTAPH
jgi:seryl-tRNA synthetase